VCAHLICASDLFNFELKGYRASKVFVYRSKRGRKPKTLTFTDIAFRENPMPIIPIPIPSIDLRPNLFLMDSDNMPRLPSINPSVETTSVASNLATTISKRITRSHNKANDKPPLNVKEVKKNVKRLQTDKRTPAQIVIISPEKKGPGRPRKARPALVI